MRLLDGVLLERPVTRRVPQTAQPPPVTALLEQPGGLYRGALRLVEISADRGEGTKGKRSRLVVGPASALDRVGGRTLCAGAVARSQAGERELSRGPRDESGVADRVAELESTGRGFGLAGGALGPVQG